MLIPFYGQPNMEAGLQSIYRDFNTCHNLYYIKKKNPRIIKEVNDKFISLRASKVVSSRKVTKKSFPEKQKADSLSRLL